jgi:PAS domain S-box-containing protein
MLNEHPIAGADMYPAPIKKTEALEADSCHAILESIEEGVFTVDLDCRITSFNRAAEKITGISRVEALGRPCSEILHTNFCKGDCVLRKVMTTISSSVNIGVYMCRSDSKSIPISVNASILRNSEGRIIGGVETFRDLTALNRLRKPPHRYSHFENMVSRNEAMQNIFSTLVQISNSDCNILIEGATGTGKELLARAIHNNSPYKMGPFVPVNCGALPDTLIESELFGYKAGAFTDAKTDKPGRFRRAQNGTIFLDEIGDISPAVQTRLLRVLEDKTYEPLGSTHPSRTNARVVVASHHNLDQLVEEKKFREDLYFRVNVMKLSLPPLAERKEDIPLLVNHFIKRFNIEKDQKILGFTQEAMAALMLYNWPGNIRELENAIEHAFVLCKKKMIDLQLLPEKILSEINVTFTGPLTTLKKIEKNAILQALCRNEWKQSITAKELGINKNTLRRKMIRYGIKKRQRR